MAVEKRPDDPAVDDPTKSLILKRGSPLGDKLLQIVVKRKAPDPKPQRVGGPAPEAAALRGKSFLEAEVGRAGHRREYRSLPAEAMTPRIATVGEMHLMIDHVFVDYVYRALAPTPDQGPSAKPNARRLMQDECSSSAARMPRRDPTGSGGHTYLACQTARADDRPIARPSSAIE